MRKARFSEGWTDPTKGAFGQSADNVCTCGRGIWKAKSLFMKCLNCGRVVSLRANGSMKGNPFKDDNQ